MHRQQRLLHVLQLLCALSPPPRPPGTRGGLSEGTPRRRLRRWPSRRVRPSSCPCTAPQPVHDRAALCHRQHAFGKPIHALVRDEAFALAVLNDERVHGAPDDALDPRGAHLDAVTGELGREHPPARARWPPRP
jgi:hypothetical protein